MAVAPDAVNIALPKVARPAVKVTGPEGAGLAPETAATVAVSRTRSPRVIDWGLTASVVTVAAAGLFQCVTNW
jgi:hypothetical protein